MEDLFPKHLLNTEAKDEINKIKAIEQEIIKKCKNHVKKKDKINDFEKFKTK